MAVFLAILAFAFMFVLQLIIARLVKPHSDDRFIISFYVILPLFLFVVLFTQNFFGFIETPVAILTYLLFFVIAASWVASYPAIYAACPTLVISFIIEKNKNTGTTLQELRAVLALKQNSTERIEDAIRNNLIRKEGEYIGLTLLGKLVFTFFSAYRRLLGLPMNTL